MGKSFSTYLDVLRVTASMLVVLEHAALLGLLPSLGVATALSHESVMVFFVLSGLVIASSSRSRQATAREYVAARAARVLSVALPALICCFGCSVALQTGSASPRLTAVQFTSAALFMNGVWTNYLEVPFNGPFWSLCHEVWYYACWGVLRFTGRRHVRIAGAALVLVAMGPAFAALFGLWLLGAFIASRQEQSAALLRRVPRWGVHALLIGSVLGVVFIGASSLEGNVRDLLRTHVHGWWRMRSAEYVLTDYAIGALMAIHLITAAYLFGDGRRFAESRVGRLVRYCAGFTFTLYLFHYPLLLALRALRAPQPASLGVGLGSIAATLVGVWVVGFATERQLPRWRCVVRMMVDTVARGTRALRTLHIAPAAAVLHRG